MESLALSQLGALAHPQRLAVFRLLMRRYPGRVAAGEIAEALDIKASTLSVYLGALRGAGLISQERAGTSLTYAAETAAASDLVGYLFEDCCRGRPEICQPEKATGVLNVLFICTGNSARSLMAEAILRDLGGGRFVVHSAGTDPRSGASALAVATLERQGHSTEVLRPKPLSIYTGTDAPQMDFVFTVCNRAANEECPVWAGGPVTAHWGEPDPVLVKGSTAERGLAFTQTYAALHRRISAFVALPFETLERASLQRHIDDIARLET